MDWKIIEPSLIPAASGFAGALIGAGLSAWTARRTHIERIKADQDLARKKFEFDCNLAHRKLAMERKLVVWRNQYDLAEKLLVAAYETRDALAWARTRVVFEGEGSSRPAVDSESAESKRRRDSAFVPIERLNARSNAFAVLRTAVDSASAHFGSEIIKSILEILAQNKKIASASEHLINLDDWNEDALRPFRDEIWGCGAEAGQASVNRAIEKIEEICKPILLAETPL